MNNNEQIKEKSVLKNVGLLLLHPFFNTLLTKLELLDKDNTITNKSLATLILHFVATGNSNEPESSMIFEKYICDVPITSNISDDFMLSNSIKKEVGEMLSSALDHWTVMKDASTESLRVEFLQRQGKIVHKEQGSKIVIERKTVDILLDKLPWNINLIKLPWKKDYLFVEW